MITKKIHYLKKIKIVVFVFFTFSCFGQEVLKEKIQLNDSWEDLLDEKLSYWESYIGVPHTTVTSLDHPKSENVHMGVPLGLNNDAKNVFSVIKENNEVVLKITGEIYGGLTSLQEFENYHLKAKFRWGEKKWEPRLDKKRDNGILYHCKGAHGAFWNVWMSSLECQIQEGDTGDFVALVHAMGDVTSKKLEKNLYKVTEENDVSITYGGKGNPGYCHINTPNEKPNGEWNSIEIICVKDKSIHVVNGKVVMMVHNTRELIEGEEKPLTKGKIQLQSEGAEAYYKEIKIKSVKDFPQPYKVQIGFSFK